MRESNRATFNKAEDDKDIGQFMNDKQGDVGYEFRKQGTDNYTRIANRLIEVHRWIY